MIVVFVLLFALDLIFGNAIDRALICGAYKTYGDVKPSFCN